MLSVVRAWVPILLVSSALALVPAAPAQADGVKYTLDPSSVGSFEVPSIITTDATVTNFLSASGTVAGSLSARLLTRMASFSPLPLARGISNG